MRCLHGWFVPCECSTTGISGRSEEEKEAMRRFNREKFKEASRKLILNCSYLSLEIFPKVNFCACTGKRQKVVFHYCQARRDLVVGEIFDPPQLSACKQSLYCTCILSPLRVRAKDLILLPVTLFLLPVSLFLLPVTLFLLPVPLFYSP